jgi:predicted MPP superfamily phosphohydrolase
MSVNWQSAAILALALPPALGHLYHFVLLINIGSGLGFAEPIMDRVRSALFLLFFASAGLLLYGHLREPWWNWAWPLRAYASMCVISGVFIAPLASLRIAFRRSPAGVTGRTSVHDLARIHAPADLIGTGKNRSLLRFPGNESFRLHLREWELELLDLPETIEGFQITQVSDLHLATCFDRKFFEAVVESCAMQPADLVVVTGDLVEDDATFEWIEPLLSRLEARLGKFAILGNHDKDHQPYRIASELDRAGFTTLDGEWTTIDCDGATLALGGTSEPWGQPLARHRIPDADFRILLSHSPDQFYIASACGIELVLSGHNHGGQIRLPLVGPVFMPSRYSRRFDRGFFRRGRTLMYASEGVAGKHPYRHGCPPEVTRFVLRAAARVSEVTPKATRRAAMR